LLEISLVALNIDALQLKQAAAAAAGGQQYPPSALYLVATPIGNLADLSLRAIHVFATVDAVACEDSRVTGFLLRHLGIEKSLITLHEHNEHRAAQEVVARLTRGQRVAYASDAGTPAVSDPGARLVAAVVGAGFRVLPIPGASSAVAAISVAGDVDAQGFRVCGYFPAKGKLRHHAIQAACADPAMQAWFEAPHRIEALAADLALRAPERRITICRELTKQFETVATMTAGQIPAWLSADPRRCRGEFVIVLRSQTATPTAETLNEDAEHTLDVLLRELPVKQAVALAAQISGAPRNALYAYALSQRSTRDDD
jgi:16S rRNA (cytidine1402-2'-O)-methyltransferase